MLHMESSHEMLRSVIDLLSAGFVISRLRATFAMIIKHYFAFHVNYVLRRRVT